jgi:hypothetical protein
MRQIITIISVLFLLAAAGSGYSQSLADLAKKEKERREKIKTDAKVIDNTNSGKYRSGAVTTGTPPPGPGSAHTDLDKDAAASSPSKPTSDEPVDLQGRSEGFWRQTLADARKRVSDLENQANVLVLRLADLQTRFYRESDGFKQQEIQREIQKTFYEQDLTKENLAKARDQVQDLEKEARKSGALPGWLSPKKP